MHYNTIKRLLACGIAVATVAGSSISVAAAEPEWGVMPDGFTFSTESTGLTMIVGGNGSNSTTKSEARQMDLTAYADEIFRLVNAEREQAGLEPVERNAEMDAVATVRAAELARSFSHTRPNGEGYTSLADDAGIAYRYIGENGGTLPAKYGADRMVEGWMNSEGHRDNMLNGKHTGVGIGVYVDGQKLYCSLMLYY